MSDLHPLDIYWPSLGKDKLPPPTFMITAIPLRWWHPRRLWAKLRGHKPPDVVLLIWSPRGWYLAPDVYLSFLEEEPNAE